MEPREAARRAFRQLGVFARLIAQSFRGENLSLRAAALTYVSVFSLVPLVTVALVLLDQLNQNEYRRRFLSFVNDALAPGVRAESAAFIERYIHNASAKAAGGIGFLFLAISAGTLLLNLDRSLNEIWSVTRKRSRLRTAAIYAIVLFIGPVFFGLSLAATAGLRHILVGARLPFVHLLFSTGAVLATVAGLTFLYAMVPNARVRFRPALIGGTVAGVGWELAKQGYAAFAAQIFRNNPLYGTLGAVPLFLVWIYTSWILVLFGARLSYSLQMAGFHGEFQALRHHPWVRELVAARIAEVLSMEPSGLSEREIASRAGVPSQEVEGIIQKLVAAGLLVKKTGLLAPALSPGELNVGQLVRAVRGPHATHTQVEERQKGSKFQRVEALFSEAESASLERLDAISWARLAVVDPRNTQKN